MNDSAFNSSKWLIVEDVHGQVIAAFVAVEMLIAVPFNAFILIHSIYNAKKYLKNGSTMLLFNLSLCSFLLTTLCMPFFVVAASKGEWIFGSTDFSRNILCNVQGFIYALLVNVSSYTLTAMSLDRCLVVTRPMTNSKYYTWKTVFGILTFIWVS